MGRCCGWVARGTRHLISSHHCTTWATCEKTNLKHLGDGLMICLGDLPPLPLYLTDSAPNLWGSNNQLTLATYMISVKFCSWYTLLMKTIWATTRQNQQNDMHPVKTLINLGIHTVWSESSLCAQWVAKDPTILHVASEDFDQTERMPRLIWVFAGRTFHWFCRAAAHFIVCSKF